MADDIDNTDKSVVKLSRDGERNMQHNPGANDADNGR